jgi:hypothetical protein
MFFYDIQLLSDLFKLEDEFSETDDSNVKVLIVLDGNRSQICKYCRRAENN